MRKLSIPFSVSAIFLSFILIACEQTGEPITAKKAQVYAGKIAAVGDSLTAGLGVAEENTYPAQLERKLLLENRPFQVINAGISGETTSGALSRINWVLKLNPDIVILETGANDGLRGIDPELTQKNIQDIILSFKEKNVTVVLAGMQIFQSLGEEYASAFGKIYPTLAQKHKVILIPFFLDDVAGVSALNQADGIHPTEEGYRVIVDTIYPFVLEAIEKAKKKGKTD